MAVRPHWLNGIAAYLLNAREAEGVRPQLRVGTFIEIAHDVRFAFASGARTVTPQLLKRDKGFRAIAPLDREFIADSLDVAWAHRMSKAKA